MENYQSDKWQSVMALFDPERRAKEEYLNPVVFAELKRRKKTNQHIANLAGCSLRAVQRYSDSQGYTNRPRGFFEVENMVNRW